MAVEWAAIIAAAVSAVSAIAKKRAEGKAEEAKLSALQAGSSQQGSQDQFAAAMAAVMADLQRRGFQRNEYQTNTQNALRGGLLQGTQDVSLTPPPGINMGQISGGLRPSSIVGREGIGRNLQNDALAALLKGGNGPQGPPQMKQMMSGGMKAMGRNPGVGGLSVFPPLPEYTQPSQMQMPRGSRADAVLGNVGQYGSILASVLAAYEANKNAGGAAAGTGSNTAGGANYMGGSTFGVAPANPNPYRLRMS